MKTLDECIARLREFKLSRATAYGIERLGVFGSVARRENTENSDVDVYVEGNLKGFFALAGIKSELEDLMHCHVDVVRLRDNMDSFFRERIIKEGVYV